MVRLMLTLTPVVCVLSAIAFSECFSYCLQDDEDVKKTPRRSGTSDGNNVGYHSDTDDSIDEPVEKKPQKNLYDKVSRSVYLCR